MPKSVGVDFSGFDELEDYIRDMEVTPEDEKRAMKKGIESAYDEVIKNTPVGRTGELKKNTKMTVKIKDMAVIGTIKADKFYAGFLEYGTSESKKHVGYFSNAVGNKTDEVVQTIADELSQKVK